MEKVECEVLERTRDQGYGEGRGGLMQSLSG